MPSPEFLAIHIMKAGGTSLRGMLMDGLGAEAVYPNSDDLWNLPNGWYPGPADLVDQVRSGQAGSPRLVIGHVPYVMAEEFEDRPVTIAVLRDPMSRSISMLEHRRTRSKRLRGASYEDLFAEEAFIAGQVQDYQTKTFAYDSVEECRGSVNQALPIDDARFQRAMKRLEQVDVLGVVEEMPAFARRLASVTGITLGEERTANRGSYERDAVPADVRRRLEQLTERDAVFYRRAQQIVAEREKAARPGPARRLFRRILGN